MNLIVGFLLLINGGNEEETLKSFYFMTQYPDFRILGLFEEGFPLVFLYIFIF